MARKITDEKLNVEMSINGVNKTQAEISKIQTSIKDLKNANEDLAAAKRKLLAEGKRESDQYKELTKKQQENRVEIDKYTKEQQKLQKQLGLTGMTMKQLVKQQSSLKSQMNNFVPGTPEWQKLNRELKETDRRLDSVRGEMRSTEGVMGRMQKSLGGFGSLFLGGAGITAAWQGIKKLVTVNAELSDSQANVMKTTGMTEQQVAMLTRSLKKFDTRTPVNELLALAEEAGRLGKDSVDDVMAFVRTADKIRVALGDDLQGDVNENVQLIGKLSEQYKVAEKNGGDFGKGMERIGSAINEVASSGANTAAFLVDYLKRLVGVSTQTTITADEQLGFAATLDEAGQSVETSGTTMSKLIVDMFTNVADYAKIAGMETSEFSKLLKEDTNEALLLFLEGLNGNGEGLEVMGNKLKDLGVEAGKGQAVLATLAASTDKVREKQEIANKAIVEGTSLTEEFNVKNANLAGNLEKLGNSIGNYFKNSALTSWLTKVTGGLLEMNRATGLQSNLLREQQFETNTLVGAIVSLNEGNEARDRLLKELQKQYPDFLGNLDKEKVTNEQLRDMLVEVNAQYREKIKLAAFGELIAENQSKAIQLQKDEEEKVLKIEELRAANNIERGKDMLETVNNIKKAAEDGIIPPGAAIGAERYLNQIVNIRKELNDLEKAAIDLEGKRSQIKIDEPGSESEENGVPEGTEKTIGGQIYIFKGGEWVLKEIAPAPDDGAEKARLRSLLSLQEKYEKEKREREAVGYVAQAELAKEMALEEANALRAKQELLDQITAEHDIKIEEAKEKQKNEELEKLLAFEERKKALEDQLRLERAISDEEREIIQAELKLEKEEQQLQADLEKQIITAEQKLELEKLLTENHEASIAEIRNHYREEEKQKNLEYQKTSLESTTAFERAKANAIRGGVGLLKGFFKEKSAIYQALFLIEKGLAISEIVTNSSKALAVAQANHAAVPIIIPGTILPNPGWGVSLANLVKNMAATKLMAALNIATIGAQAITGVTGFEDGLYQDVVRTDGKRFRAKNMGRTKTQIVNEPSYFKDYLTGEAGPELIVDSATFRQLDPEVIQHIMDVRHNVRGFESGMYPTSTTGGSSTIVASCPELKIMIAGMMNLLQNPPSPTLVYGYQDEKSRKELQMEIEQSENNGKLTP